ncbi:hypothetical protein [Roseibacillus persicicus]|uniref:hypothetical protein n=1 Tax=Roseibacillus persicicus TaxID=454148 RepID=UPI00167B07A9
MAIIALVCSHCNRRDFTERPEVRAEIHARESDGWDFVEMVGEAHGKPDPNGQEVRFSGKSEAITVFAMNSGSNGYSSRQQEWRKVFQEDVVLFLEVKVMTSPADSYSLVFRKTP